MANQEPTTLPDVRPGAPAPPRAEPPDPSKRPDTDGPQRPRRLWVLAVVLLVIFGLLFVVGILPRLHRRPQLREAAQAQKDPTPLVNVVPVQAPPPTDVLTLPGNVQAAEQTAVNARASGYVKKWLVDIGDHVRAGQTLAVLSTPDVDQSVAQARAQVSQAQAAAAQAQANLSTQQANLAQARANLSRAQASYEQARTDLAHAQASVAQAQETSAQQAAQVAQAQANLNLARVTTQRYQNLLADGAIDQQSADQAAASYQTNLANVNALQSAERASRANVVAFQDAVRSSRANVTAYAEGIRAGQAAVAGAAANVASYRAAVSAAQAGVRAGQANLARSVALQGFQNVTAPFAGVVTARNIDNGALVTAGGGANSSSDSSTVGSGSVGSTSLGNAAGGSATGSGASPATSTTGSSGGGTPTSLFSIAQTDTLRVYVNVPQTYAGDITTGQVAQIVTSEMAAHPFLGHVVRSSVALDAASRTLVAEIDVPNRQGLLRPGTTAQVRLRVVHPQGALLVPDAALLTNAGGTQVLLVTPQGKLHFQPITVGRDFGQTLEVTAGLRRGQQIVVNPNDALHEGQTVHAAPAPPPAQGGG